MKKLISRARPCSLSGFPDYMAALLCARGVSDPGEAAHFLHPGLEQLQDPFTLGDMGKACWIIREAAREGHTAVVYGDYDADGVCASAILLRALEEAGLSAFSYIPDRFSEGYGLNAEAVRMLSREARLLISVDCGVTALEETIARQKDIDRLYGKIDAP